MKGFVRKSFLVTVAEFVAIAFGVGIAQAQSGTTGACPSGSVNITSPGAGTTIPSTATVTASASSGGACDITALRLYVDYQPYYTETTGGSPSGGFSIPTTFGPGYHLLNVVAWDNSGDSFASPGYEVYVAPQDQTVYITIPAPNQTFTRAFTIAARARWDNQQITHMRVYVDGQDEYDVDNPEYGAVDVQKAFNPGQHSLVVIAWNGAGNYIKADENFTVSN